MRLIDCDKLRDELGDEVLMEEVDGDNSIDDIIANAPTVEAIPTEWLLTTGMMMVDNDTRTKLFNLISLWRKENEKK